MQNRNLEKREKALSWRTLGTTILLLTVLGCNSEHNSSNPSGGTPEKILGTVSELSCGDVQSNQSETRIQYFSGVLSFGSNCEEPSNKEVQSRKCTNGTFSDWSGQAAFETCKIAADPDLDADLVPNDVDNCPSVANIGQEDIDSDAQGDACDAYYTAKALAALDAY